MIFHECTVLSGAKASALSQCHRHYVQFGFQSYLSFLFEVSVSVSFGPCLRLTIEQGAESVSCVAIEGFAGVGPSDLRHELHATAADASTSALGDAADAAKHFSKLNPFVLWRC